MSLWGNVDASNNAPNFSGLTGYDTSTTGESLANSQPSSVFGNTYMSATRTDVEFMEIKQEHRDWLIANESNYESAKNGYIRNLDLPVLQMYEHIYRLYMDPNFVLSVWCGNCKYDMIMRLYKWFEAQ